MPSSKLVYSIRQNLGKNLLILLFMLGLSSCATVPPAPKTELKQSWAERQAHLYKLNHWKLSGKVALRTSQDSGSATFDWRQSNRRYRLALYTPLGGNLLKLSGGPGSATLELSDGKKLSGKSPEELLQRGWQFDLPVSYLKYWIRGVPVPGIPKSQQLDAQHRLTQLSQQGWQINFKSYTRAANMDLPTRIDIQSNTLKAKIIIYSWKRE